MPDVMRLRYIGATTINVPVLGRDVEPDTVIDIPARQVTDPGELRELGLVAPLADCLLVMLGNPPEVRTFPTSLWRDETPVKKISKE